MIKKLLVFALLFIVSTSFLINAEPLKKDAQGEFITEYDKTQFFKAAEEGNSNKISLLLKKMPKLVFEKDREGWTGLIYAARFNHKNIIQLLIKSGSKIEDCDNEKFTALHHAAASGRLEAVKELIKLGAKVNAKTNGSVTPKKLADSNGHPGVASYIGGKGGH